MPLSFSLRSNRRSHLLENEVTNFLSLIYREINFFFSLARVYISRGPLKVFKRREKRCYERDASIDRLVSRVIVISVTAHARASPERVIKILLDSGRSH